MNRRCFFAAANLRRQIRVWLWCVLVLAGGLTASAAIFNVNSPADVPDANPGDGICETAPGNGICTLRAAIQEANASSGADTINLQANTTYTLTRPGNDETALNGDLDILDNLTIVGAGPASTIIDGNGAVTGDRVLYIAACKGNAFPGGGVCPSNAPAVVVSISGVTIQHGQLSYNGFGGGIFNVGTLTLTNCSVSNNTVNFLNDFGGGVYNAGPLTMTNCTIANNTSGSHNPYGGGIYNQAPLTITDSTISGNTTGGVGGGICSLGANVTIRNSTIAGNTGLTGGGIYTSSNIILINSTISGNFSTGNGGGIFANNGTTSLFNVTVTKNRANSDNSGVGTGGGLAAGSSATLNFQNSIIALNENVVVTGGGNLLNNDDCLGTITSQGHNIMHDVNAGYCTVNGAVTIADPDLGPLQNNGGSTQTHAILGGPALDGGSPSGCTDNLGAILTGDQRGYHRPSGASCDVGAFEAVGTELANISTRLAVQAGNDVLIGGFIVIGTQPKKVIVRALGPSLNVGGVPVAGRLADTTLELRDGAGGLIAMNDNWRSTQQGEIIASTVPPPNDLESAIVATLPANTSSYTAIVRGAGNSTGIGQVEVYDLDQSVDSQLANISTRGVVQTGDNVMIGGIIVTGITPRRVIVRAIGPSLNTNGVPVPGRLADPTLELRDASGTLVAMNDNWRSTQEAEIIATTVPPPNDLESAIVLTIPPAGYTAIVRGVNGTTGIALVEAFALTN